MGEWPFTDFSARRTTEYLGTATRNNDDGTFYSLSKSPTPRSTQSSAPFSALGRFRPFLFFYKIKRKYWATFYSTRTGCQQTMSYFLEHKDDATKSLVFGDHTDLWKKIENEVQEWTLTNWSKWEEEKPEWFTEHFKESVPGHMIPKLSLEELPG